MPIFTIILSNLKTCKIETSKADLKHQRQTNKRQTNLFRDSYPEPSLWNIKNEKRVITF